MVSAGLPRPIMCPARALTAADVNRQTGRVPLVRPWRCGSTKQQRRLKARRMMWANESAQVIGAKISFSADDVYFCITAKVMCSMYKGFWEAQFVGKCRAAGVSLDQDSVCWGWCHCDCPNGCSGDCNQILQRASTCAPASAHCVTCLPQ